MTPAAIGLGSFSAVDAEPDTSALVAALDEQASAPAIQRLRAAVPDLLGARLGHRVLDAGCGTGDLARLLAGFVGATGSVVGIEASDTMLAEACRRVGPGGLPIVFRQGDICDLDLPDSSFDAAVSERVLQHLDRPHRAVAELARVVRPGGRVAVIDTDWGMHAVHGGDPLLTAAIVDAWQRNAANGLSGRRLPALFADAGLRDVIVRADTITSTDPARATSQPITSMASFAERAGAIDAGHGERWIRDLVHAGEHGRFFWAVTMFAVAGTTVGSST